MIQHFLDEWQALTEKRDFTLAQTKIQTALSRIELGLVIPFPMIITVIFRIKMYEECWSRISTDLSRHQFIIYIIDINLHLNSQIKKIKISNIAILIFLFYHTMYKEAHKLFAKLSLDVV